MKYKNRRVLVCWLYLKLYTNQQNKWILVEQLWNERLNPQIDFGAFGERETVRTSLPWKCLGVDNKSIAIFDSRTSTGSRYFGIAINAHTLTCLTRSHSLHFWLVRCVFAHIILIGFVIALILLWFLRVIRKPLEPCAKLTLLSWKDMLFVSFQGNVNLGFCLLSFSKICRPWASIPNHNSVPFLFCGDE